MMKLKIRKNLSLSVAMLLFPIAAGARDYTNIIVILMDDMGNGDL